MFHRKFKNSSTGFLPSGLGVILHGARWLSTSSEEHLLLKNGVPAQGLFCPRLNSNYRAFH